MQFQLNPDVVNLLTPRVTKYIPHTPFPKQLAFLWLTCPDALYGGAAGGGKSDALLMAALQYVDIPLYNAVLIRDTYKNLTMPGALLERSTAWLTGTDAEWQKDRWVFPSGATLSFGYLDGPKDHYNYQSSELQFVGIDEIANIREEQAIYLFSRLRKKEPKTFVEDLLLLPQFRDVTQERLHQYARAYYSTPLRFRCGSNPPTLLQMERGQWVKDRYVDAKTKLKKSVFIPAKLTDNPHINAEEYRRSLKHLDPVTRHQLEFGDWDINPKGHLFDRSWFEIVDKAPGGKTVRYWDLAATEEKRKKTANGPAYTAGAKMSLVDGVFYIEDIYRFRKRPMHVERAIKQTAQLDTASVIIGMEQEPGAGGVNTVDHYRRRVLVGFTLRINKKTRSKIAEAQPFSSAAEAGNVKIVKGRWNREFLDEIELFPHGLYKDQTDAVTGAYHMLVNEGVARIRVI